MMRTMIAATTFAVLAGLAQAQTSTDPETGKAPPGARVAPGQESTIDARRPNTTGSVGRDGADTKTPTTGPSGRMPGTPANPAPHTGKGGAAGSPGG